MVFIRQQWLSTLQGSYSDWTFDVFADACSHKILSSRITMTLSLD